MDEDVEKNDVNTTISSSRLCPSRKIEEDDDNPDYKIESEMYKSKPITNLRPKTPEAYDAVVAELKNVIVEASRIHGPGASLGSNYSSGDEGMEKVGKERKSILFPVVSNKTSGVGIGVGAGGNTKQLSICRKPSDLAAAATTATRNKINQEANFLGFEKLKRLNSVTMSLDWINFKIRDESGEELFQAVQSRYCSLSVTGRNELFLRKANAENVLRVNSSAEEDLRNFNFYTPSDKHIGTISCNIRQNFKVPSTIRNKISGRTYNVTVQHEGEIKFWQIDDVGTEMTVASVKVQVGHRWKSIYTLTFIQETSISSQILIVGFLLALASARLESEIVPAFFAMSAVLLTFIIFFIIQFT